MTQKFKPMSDAFPLLIVACFIILVPLVAFIKHSGYMDRIAKEIKAKGYKPISIERRWIDFDENTATYDVEYQDEYGNGYQTSCKIRSLFIFFEGNLYWTKPFSGRDGKQINREMTQQLVIDSLRKENKQLKERISELESITADMRNDYPTQNKQRPYGRR